MRATMIGKDLVAASATPMILSVLLDGENYGYEIIRRVKSVSGNQLDWSESMLYPALRRLEDRGLLKSRWVASEAGPNRKYYAITRQGRSALAAERDAWMTIHATLQALWGPKPCPT